MTLILVCGACTYILASIFVLWFMLDTLIECGNRIAVLEKKLKEHGIF